MLLESWKRSSAAFEDYRDRYTPEAFLDTVLTRDNRPAIVGRERVRGGG